MTLNVQSEVGVLRQVIVHRPGLELSRLTPRNVSDLLFDDVMWAKKAKEEHDEFAADLHPRGLHSLKWDMLRSDDFVLPPLPNHLFQRDNSCWIYGGVSINPMAKPARQRETLHSRAIYRYHPMFAGQDFVTYYGDDDADHLPATVEGVTCMSSATAR